MQLPPPTSPPPGMPPVLLTLGPDWDPDTVLSPAGSVDDGRLAVRAMGPAGATGQAFSPASFRDVVLDAVVSLEAGAEKDAYGLFFRQVAERTYLAFVVTPDGRGAVLSLVDGVAQTLTEGALPADAPFGRGAGAANRLTVVAAGPCVTCLVNGFVLAGVIIDARFKAGLAGAVLVHGGASPDARMAVHWAQVRALLPDEG